MRLQATCGCGASIDVDAPYGDGTYQAEHLFKAWQAEHKDHARARAVPPVHADKCSSQHLHGICVRIDDAAPTGALQVEEAS